MQNSNDSSRLPDVTRVSGVGMWNVLTRNFKEPIRALLDLMDNAFDAACVHNKEEPFQGHVFVYPDKNSLNETTGLVILNDSFKFIKPMAQILEVYQSSKGNKSESIGENGVGLKQGAANLSDLSFALSKNRGQYSLGVLAKSLQRDEGCVYPPFSFTEFPTSKDLKQAFAEYPIVGECIAQYGNGSLDYGVERLLDHYESMLRLNDRGYAFCVILHQLKHNAESSNTTIDVDQEEDEENQVNHAQNAEGLMKKLKQELPRQYIHVSSSLDVRVNGEKIVFAYWQRRLVELSSFEINIDPKRPAAKAEDWQNPANGYSLKVYAGFDPIRLNVSSKGAASLLIYSRQSGRLIMDVEDCRNMLGLTASGTDFSQGLTILVDDFHGKLPLTPTKQDLAFSHETHGETHRQNLFNWLAAITKLYYKSHLGKMEKKQKQLLTAEIKSHYKTIQTAQNSLHTIPKPLPECNLSTIQNIPWYWRLGKITHKNTMYQVVSGEDTLINIREANARDAKKEKKTATKKRKASPTAASGPPRKQATSNRHKDNTKCEEESHDDELLEAQNEEILSQRKILKKFRRAIRQQEAQIEELQRENARLKEEPTNLNHQHKRTARKSVIGSLGTDVDQAAELAATKAEIRGLKQELDAANERAEAAEMNAAEVNEQASLLAAAESKIEELDKALEAANERAEIAEGETEIQQDIANELRKKMAELRRVSKHKTSL